MKRNLFGEPLPKDLAEMQEVLNATDYDGSQINATVDHNDTDDDFKGWSAEVRENENGEAIFSTLGYADKDKLISDLRALGIRRSDIEVNS